MGIAIVFVVMMIAICAISLLFIKKYNDKILSTLSSSKELKKEISMNKSKKIIISKDNFKRMIDSMSDDEFLNFIEYINACTKISDEDYDEELWSGDEGWEDEAAKFYGYNLEDIEDDDSLPV